MDGDVLSAWERSRLYRILENQETIMEQLEKLKALAQDISDKIDQMKGLHVAATQLQPVVEAFAAVSKKLADTIQAAQGS